MSLAASIREYGRLMGRFRIAEAARELDASHERVGSAVSDLVKQGDLKRVGRGVYEFVDRRAATRSGPKMQAVWKAMRLSATWTIREIARQAGVTDSYTAKLTREWKRTGFVRGVGQKRPVSGTGSEKIYQLKDRSRLCPPGGVAEKPDPLKTLAWKALGRIVLDKIRHPGEREQCVKEVKKLLEALNEQCEK